MLIRLSGNSYKKSKATEGTGQNKRRQTQQTWEATSPGAAGELTGTEEHFFCQKPWRCFAGTARVWAHPGSRHAVPRATSPTGACVFSETRQRKDVAEGLHWRLGLIQVITATEQGKGGSF